VEIVEYLISKGASCVCPTKYVNNKYSKTQHHAGTNRTYCYSHRHGWTLLHTVGALGVGSKGKRGLEASMIITDMLLQQPHFQIPAHVNQVDERGRTAADVALQMGNAYVAEKLMAANGVLRRFGLTNSNGWGPLHQAAKMGDLHAMTSLLAISNSHPSFKINIDEADKVHLWTPLVCLSIFSLSLFL